MDKRRKLNEKDYKHNEKMMVLDGIGWSSGFELFNASSIISVFIYTLTGSVTMAGLASALQSGGMMIGQLITGPKVSKISDGSKTIVKYTLLSRLLLLLAIISILLPFSPMVIAYIFLSMFFISWLYQGGVALVWMDMFPRVIPHNSVGKVMGLRGTLGYIMAFVAGLLVKWIMSNSGIDFKIKYMIIIGLGVLFSSLCVIALKLIRDVGPKNRVVSHSIKEMLKDIPEKIKLPQCMHFRKFLIVRLFIFLADAMLPFMLVFAASNGGLSEPQIATLVFVKIIGSLIAAYFGGKLIDKIGAQMLIFSNLVIRVILSAICIFLVFSPQGNWEFYIILVILTGIGVHSYIGYTSYTMVVTPEEIRPDMLLVSAIIGLPFSVLAFVLGRLADNVGFLPLLIGMGVFSLVGAVLCKSMLLNKVQQQEFVDR